jgi:hypothetical protein
MKAQQQVADVLCRDKFAFEDVHKVLRRNMTPEVAMSLAVWTLNTAHENIHVERFIESWLNARNHASHTPWDHRLFLVTGSQAEADRLLKEHLKGVPV